MTKIQDVFSTKKNQARLTSCTSRGYCRVQVTSYHKNKLKRTAGKILYKKWQLTSLLTHASAVHLVTNLQTMMVCWLKTENYLLKK